MAGGLSDILAALQNGVVAINRVRQQVAATFPRMGSVSVAPRGSGGTITFTSSQAVAFMPVTTSSGFVGYVPIYPSS
jgi:hypothetical protein